MERKLWKSFDGSYQKEQHCGNCANSIKYLDDKQKKLACNAIVREVDSQLEVESTCSGVKTLWSVEVVDEKE